MATHAITTNPFGDVQVAVYQRTKEITNAQILTLPTTPVELVPAPGPGKVVVIRDAIFYKPELTAPYTGTVTDGDALVITYDGDTGFLTNGISNDVSVGLSDPQKMLDNDSVGELLLNDQPYRLVSQGYNRPIRLGVNISAENKAVVLNAYITEGNFSGGDAANFWKVTVEYSIVDL